MVAGGSVEPLSLSAVVGAKTNTGLPLGGSLADAAPCELKCLNYCRRVAAERSPGHHHVLLAIKEDGWVD